MAEADCPGTTIAVHRGAWSNLAPEFAAMVAPPISVSALPVIPKPGPVFYGSGPDPWRRAQQARSRANMPVGRHRRPTR
jgi:hypothetical protein